MVLNNDSHGKCEQLLSLMCTAVLTLVEFHSFLDMEFSHKPASRATMGEILVSHFF